MKDDTAVRGETAASACTSTMLALPPEVDLLVVGGGVNGAGIARDAAGRGWSVLLCERDDLAAHTSSASTKLIHGGLRYLEQHAFGLVRKALAEREVLLAIAPHIIRPLRFVLPHEPSMRPAWMMRLGLFLYDHLAHRDVLPGSQAIDLRVHPTGGKLLPRYRQGFMYSDAWVDDARLVALNAVAAAAEGARVLTRTACVDCRPDGTRWRVTLRSSPALPDEADAGACAAGPATGARAGPAHTVQVRARAVVNATGQWVADFPVPSGQMPALPGQASTGRRPRRVQGSHIVVPKLFDHGFAYILQNDDRRIVFAIPYEQDYTLVGTTEVELGDAPARARPTAAEVDYLCAAINRYFTRSISPADVVWRFAGIRPLLDDDNGDPSAVTRDYQLELPAAGLPLLTVRGGKLTTYRRLATEAVDRLASRLADLPRRRASDWTAHVPLPGGDIAPPVAAASDHGDRGEAMVRAAWPWLPLPLARRWARAYGTRTRLLVGDSTDVSGLGPEIVPGLPETELRYLVAREWARTADDVLWRRSKLGLRLSPAERAAVADWMARHAPVMPTASVSP